MSSSDLLKRLRELELKALQTSLHDDFPAPSAYEKENKKPGDVKQESGLVKPKLASSSKPSLRTVPPAYERSPPDSGCVTEEPYPTCSNNVLSTAEMNFQINANSYTNLPSIASGSSTNDTRISAPSDSVMKQQKIPRTQTSVKSLPTYQSDSALRTMRSTSVDSPRQTPSLGGCKVIGRSASNLRLQAPPQKQHHSSSASKNPEIEINSRTYVVLGPLGRGGSSKVYQVLDPIDNKLCALKCVDLSRTDGEQKEAYLNEIQLLKRLSSSGCVIKLYDYELRKKYLYILMEKGDTDLATFLKTRRTDIEDHFIRFYWKEMLNCVSVIHKEGVVHLDLKPANFLFVKGALKLIDFGIASALPSNKTSVLKETQMGTLSYMAPEVIKGTTSDRGGGDGRSQKQGFKVNRKADVWSLGCILFNMVYGRTPFQQYRSIFEKANAIMNEPVTFPSLEDKDLLDVMTRCLEKDPERRASVEDLQNHRYLRGKRRPVPEQSILLKGEADFLKMAEDLRQRSPASCAKKLRDLMLKRGSSDQS